MKALVIGATGFVGKHLLNELSGDGQKVVATKLPGERIENAGCGVIDLDILDETAVYDALVSAKADVIYHLAAQSSVAVSWAKPRLTVDVNITGSLNLLEALRKLDYKPSVVLIGSSEEYGAVKEEDNPVKETQPPNPQNVYAVTKLAQNRLGAVYASAYGLNIIMTRAFNHIGAGQSDTFAIPSFCRQAAEIAQGRREPVIRVGNLCARRDFTDVRDIARAYRLLSEKGVPGETYNIGSGRAIALSEILDEIIRISGAVAEVRADPERARPIDVPVIEADAGKLKAATGWSPAIKLEETLKEMLCIYSEETHARFC